LRDAAALSKVFRCKSKFAIAPGACLGGSTNGRRSS
jgi:hypothetical protein